MRIDIVFPGGSVDRTSLADGQHTEVANDDGVICRATRISAGHLKLEIHPEATLRPKKERVRFRTPRFGKARAE